MRFLRVLFKRLCPFVTAAALSFLCRGADTPDNVALQYHFLGAAQLAGNTNLAVAEQAFAMPSTERFENMVLNRLAEELANSLHFPTNAQTIALLRPLLDDLLRAESVASVGGPAGQPVNYVVAVHLAADRAQLWEHNLKTANPPGANNSFWVEPAGDWLLVGRGSGLASVRSDYLQQIQKTGRPAPALDFNWFEADVDWPRLVNWFPLPSCPLKLGRTQVALSAEKGGIHMIGQVTYPEPIDWHPRPWRIPTNLVREPLISFAAGQDVEAFLKSDEILSRLCTRPLSDQFVFWSMRQMPLQSYMAWPVQNPAATLQQLASQILPALNPYLKAYNGEELVWNAQGKRIYWNKIQLAQPSIEAAPPTDPNFLVAGVFPLTPGIRPAPGALWEQFQGRTDLVYYDWEFTGPRLRQLRTLTQLLPVLQALDVGPKDPFAPGKPMLNIANAKVLSRLNVEEEWLEGLTALLRNTVTDVAKTGPAELTITRNSPFVFSSLELLLLSHWLSDTPAGPLNMKLLPQAKMSVGMPPHR